MTGTREKLSPFIATSAALHALLFVAVVFGPLVFPKSTQPQWGSPIKGVKVGMTPSMPGIPLPSPPKVDEAAKGSETKTLNPAEVAPKEQKKPAVKEADIKVPSGSKKPEKKDPETTRVARAETKEPPPPPSNAIPGAASGQPALPYAVAGPGTSQASFTGSDGSSFGTKFPQYVTSLVRAIQLEWDKENIVQVARGTSPRVYVKFTIGKRGDVSNLEIDQPSGSAQLDGSGKRAVQRASIPPLPQAYSGSSVDVRFYFEYTR
jgi:TonB family protein